MGLVADTHKDGVVDRTRHKAQHTHSGVLLPGAGTGAAIPARESSRRWEMRPSNLEFNTSMDLRMTAFSATSGVLSLFAFSARISAAAASISPFKSASCFSVLRSKASLGHSGVRVTGPEGGGGALEKKRARAPRDEEGVDEEDEDSEWRRKVDGAKR